MAIQRSSKEVLHLKRQKMLNILSKLADRDTCQVQISQESPVNTLLTLDTLCCRLLWLSCHSSSRYMFCQLLALPCTG